MSLVTRASSAHSFLRERESFQTKAWRIEVLRLLLEGVSLLSFGESIKKVKLLLSASLFEKSQMRVSQLSFLRSRRS